MSVLAKIGKESWVVGNNVLMVAPSYRDTTKSLLRLAKEKHAERIINICGKSARKTVVFLKDGWFILSPWTTDRISKDLMHYELPTRGLFLVQRGDYQLNTDGVLLITACRTKAVKKALSMARKRDLDSVLRCGGRAKKSLILMIGGRYVMSHNSPTWIAQSYEDHQHSAGAEEPSS